MARTTTPNAPYPGAPPIPVPKAEVVLTMAYLERLVPDAKPSIVVAEGFQHPGPIRELAAERLRGLAAEATRETGPPAPWQWRELDRLGIWVCYAWWESTVAGESAREHFRRRRLRCVRVGVWDKHLARLEWQPLDEENEDTRPFFEALRERDGHGRTPDGGAPAEVSR